MRFKSVTAKLLARKSRVNNRCHSRADSFDKSFDLLIAASLRRVYTGIVDDLFKASPLLSYLKKNR